MPDQAKPKRILTEEQKAKMKEALAAKRADPEWQKEQERKREERKAKKAEDKSKDEKPKTEKKKRVISDEQKAKMKAALAAKRADPAWQEEQKRKREERKAQKGAGRPSSDEESE